MALANIFFAAEMLINYLQDATKATNLYLTSELQHMAI